MNRRTDRAWMRMGALVAFLISATRAAAFPVSAQMFRPSITPAPIALSAGKPFFWRNARDLQGVAAPICNHMTDVRAEIGIVLYDP